MAQRLRLPQNTPAPTRGLVRSLATKAINAAFNWTGIVSAVGTKISLIPYYLSGLLWLLSEKFLDLARYGYAGNSAVYACLRLLSQSVPEPPLLAYTVLSANRQEVALDYDHPLCALIRNPNPLMTEYEFWELTTLHMGIAGRTTWWKERNNAGAITALWPLRPDRVGPVYSVDTAGENPVISGWSYLIPGTTHYVPLPRRDVFFANWPDPAGESGGVVEGLGPLQVLASEVGADNEATKFVGSLLSNHAMPGAVIATKNAVPDEVEASRIKANFYQEFGGMKRGSVALIDEDSTVTQIGFDLQQLEFPALRKHTESRICSAFGVPAILVGAQVGLESGVRATIAEQREYFADTTLSNYWRRYADAFTRDVASEFEDNIVCKFDITKVKALALLAAGETEKIADGFRLGAVTIDQYLQRVLGLPPLPVGGDHRILPRGAIEVNAIGQIVQAAGVPGPGAPTGTLEEGPAAFNADTMADVSGTIIPTTDDATPVHVKPLNTQVQQANANGHRKPAAAKPPGGS